MKPDNHFDGFLARLDSLMSRGLLAYASAILLIILAVGLAVFLFINSAVPTTITFVGGREGSMFRRFAERYQKILAREGIELKIITSEGSKDNLMKLADRKVKVDVGFVQGGEVDDVDISSLVSLGSVGYQPLVLFYRGEHKSLISEFKGKRIYIGQKGSGVQPLALAILKLNGIEPGEDTILATAINDDYAHALTEDRIDALFLMSDAVSIEVIRKLLGTPGVRLFNFTQADGYTRRITYLNKLIVPRGTFDFGKDIPSEDVQMVAPSVELIARDGLHPALIDLLLEAAKEIHGPAGIFKKAGEFPVAQEREFKISPNAKRYYDSGRSYLYRTFPFWIASLISRSMTAVVPIALLLIPGLKIIPKIYHWRMRARVYRWYRALFELEREAFGPSADPGRRAELIRRLEHIETTVNRIIVPASYGDLLYALRGHIDFVRNRLLSGECKSPGAHPPKADA